MITTTGNLLCKDLEFALSRFERKKSDLPIIFCFERIGRNSVAQIGSVAALELCSRITLADLSKTGRCRNVALQMQDEFVKAFPDTFPLAAVKVGNNEVEIPQYRLTLQSRKFETMLRIPLEERATNRVELHPLENPSNDAIVSFLRFVQTGMLNVTEATCLDLFLLAEENDMPMLSQRILERARSFINIDLCKDWLILAVRRDYSALKYICLEFATKTAPEDLKNIISTTEHPEVEEILQLAMALQKSSVVLGSHGIGSITFKNIAFIRDEKKLALIQRLHRLTPLHTVEITSGACLDQHLTTLSQFITAPLQLFLSETGVTHIPENWIQSLQTIVAEECRRLIRVVSDTALEVKLTNCDHLLTEVDTPNATYVSIHSCTKVARVIAHRAYELECVGSDFITELLADEAIIVNVCNNQKLAKLFVPKALKILFDRNPALEALHAPNALQVHSILGCENLESIYAPQAHNVLLGVKSPRLTSVTMSEGGTLGVAGDYPMPKGCTVTRAPGSLSREQVQMALISLLDEPIALPNMD